MQFFAAALLLSGALVSCGDDPKPVSDIQTFAQLEKEFTNPTNEYRTAPFFVWNSDTKKSDIDFAMAEFKKKGVGGVFIHPRMGMITEYLSDDWNELCKYTLEKGKELGIDIWLYDENGFPSGMAGGLTAEQMPDSYKQGHSLGMEVQDTLNLHPTPPVRPEGLIETGQEARPFGAAPEYTVILKEENGKLVDITATAASEEGKIGKYYLFPKLFMPTSPRFGGYPYVNLLMPGVTEKFIEITMPSYEKSIGSEFGKSVHGIFTDEPNIRPAVGATWFTDMFERFQERWGYDLKLELPKLFTEVGDDWRKVRYQYRQFLMEMEIERWSKPWKEYCDAHNLKWTGHYWEHAWPNPHVTPDNMMMYSFHHVPAIDILFNQYDESNPAANFGNVRSVREVRSLANQMGRNRTLCEIYAGSGWELDFNDMKRQGDWINVLGITTITQHYSPVSIKGIRKLDYPQVFSYQEPWWPYYDHLGEYHARISAAVSAGDQVNDILVIEPTTSAWMYFIRGENKVGYKIGQIAKPFQKFVTDLETNQVEYDLGSEEVMKEYAKVKSDKLAVGNRDYKTVVIPSTMENINASTLGLLKEYVANGGKLLVFGDGPIYLDGAEDPQLAEFFGKNENIVKLGALDMDVLNKYFRSDVIRFADNVADQGRLFHMRREMKDGQVLFLTNTSDSVRISGEVTIDGADVLQLNALTGAITDYPEVAKDGKVTIKYDIYPAGNLLLFVSDSKRNGYEPTPFYENMAPVASESVVTSKRDQDNVLVIDYCDMTVNGKTSNGLNVYKADNKAYEALGFPGGNPWFFSAQRKDEFNTHKFPENSSLSNAYHFTIADDFDYSGMKAVVERADKWNITVNGQEVKPEAGQWWVDMDFGVLNIGKYLKKGENTITTSVSPVSIFSETMPIYIIGDFTVNPTAKNWVIGKPAGMETGSWKAQGMPFYSQSATYTKTFDVAEPASHYEVELTDWNGTVAEVIVNGESAGIIAWQPYRADVSKLIKKGTNTVEVKVIGSHKNLFGLFYGKPRGQVSPALMKRAPEKAPAPTEYDLFDYGLMGGINLLYQ